jgi:hypothetical protein
MLLSLKQILKSKQSLQVYDDFYSSKKLSNKKAFVTSIIITHVETTKFKWYHKQKKSHIWNNFIQSQYKYGKQKLSLLFRRYITVILVYTKAAFSE